MRSHSLGGGWWVHGSHVSHHVVLLGEVSWVGSGSGLLHLVLPRVLFLLDLSESLFLELLIGLEGVGI